jgi:hypothetical protein
VRRTNVTGEPTEQLTIADDFGNGAEWYLTIRCARSACGQLIALFIFQIEVARTMQHSAP